MTNKEIINHPDSFLLMCVNHSEAAFFLIEMNASDYDNEFFLAIDGSHQKLSKVYALSSADAGKKALQ